MSISKSLVALAVMAAAGTAMAQSSVTLYGAVDAGIGRINAAGGSDANGKWQFTSNSLMNYTTSYIGLKGVEDLGSGLKVGFQLEQGVDLDNGSSVGTAWSRGTNVWIGGDSWGRVTLGRADSPSFGSAPAWELTGAANYSPIVNTYGVAGEGRYNDSQFKYSSPNWGGFGFEAAYVSKNDRADNANKWDANVTYANGPIGVGLGVNKTSGLKTNYLLGAKYSFGNFAVATSFAESPNLYGVDGRRRGVSLGGQAIFGAASVTLDLTRDLKREIGGVSQKKYTNGVLVGKYALSKRTSIYGAFLRLDSTNNYGVGITHNF